MLSEETIESLRRTFPSRLKETGLAGENTRHSRADNLQSIHRLIEGHWHYTFGIEGLKLGTAEEILQQTARITGCSSDPEFREGGGVISSQKTFDALVEAGERLRECRGKRLFLGTGHPGSLLGFYLRLQRLAEKHGIEVVTPNCGPLDATRDVDRVEKVAILQDRASILHTHEGQVGWIALDDLENVELAFCDHGFAAGALNRGIPAICIMDTNDPAFAVAKGQGMDLTIVPMDDNRPMGAYKPALDLLAKLLDA